MVQKSKGPGLTAEGRKHEIVNPIHAVVGIEQGLV